MLKYISMSIVFQEVPDEISLAVSITGCPNHCPDCHSKYLWEDTGDELTEKVLDSYISAYIGGITCVCFMGGDADKQTVYRLGKYVKDNYPDLKIAWYSGSREIDTDFPWSVFDYIKVGPYIQRYGPLDSANTNQYMLKKNSEKVWEDITHVFYRNRHPELF